MISFSFWIQTNSRTKETLNLMNQLKKFSDYGSIYLSDSGRRGKDHFINAAKNSKINLPNFNYVDNSKHALSAYDHFVAITKKSKNNMFLFHDDDLINVIKFKKNLDFIRNNPNIHFLCTTKEGYSKFLDNFNRKKPQNRINQILKLYFLSHDNNCLLLTGIFIKEPYKIIELAGNFARDSKYGDVSLMCYLFSRPNSHVTYDGYVQHIEHAENDNNQRSYKDRKDLSNFISGQPGMTNKIISKLIFFGYPNAKRQLILGLALSAFYPLIWKHLLMKLYHSKIKNN